MKNNKIYRFLPIVIVTIITMVSCSDDFLRDKEDFSRTTAAVYNSYDGAKGRIDNIYSLLLPRATSEYTYDYPSSGVSDAFSQSTEEYGGLSKYVDIDVLTNSDMDDFFYNEAKTSRSPWGRIRNCNDAIKGIANSTLNDAQKTELLGQAYFWRAWVYYRLVKMYGGVPIVTEPQDAIIGDDPLKLVIPRSSTKECIEFICSDLQKAADYLPVLWDDSNWGRVTSGTALAVMGRVRLLYASPLFNRTDNLVRWDSAYAVNKRAIEKLQASNYFGLAYASDVKINAGGWAKMFSDIKSPEAVMVTLYNAVPAFSNKAPNFNNGWENSIRPYNTYSGSTGRGTTAEMVDLFPLADGSRAVDKSGTPINNYDPKLFFLNRDPRFYRTFAFPGVEWKYKGDATSKGAMYPYKGEDYTLWNYAWYKNDADRNDEGKSGYAADGLGDSFRGIYIRKRTDDLALNSSPNYDVSDFTLNKFTLSASPYIELRYAEVLLNFAEAACGAGHGQEALDALRLIRQRVGYTGNCGLDDALATDRGALFGAILYERQIELAYEGKRFEDMRRWLLWDGGANFSNVPGGAPSTWTLSGFNGNTCTYIGVEPLNGKRRNGVEICVSPAAPNTGIAAADMASDPIKTLRPAALNLNLALSTQITALENFYRSNLTRKVRTIDTKERVISFRPEYYFFGLKPSAQTNNVTLLQNIGWQDSQKGAMGTFDPLAE